MENIQINKIKNKKGVKTIDTKGIQRIRRTYFKTCTVINSKTQKKWMIFLIRYHPSKSNQDQISNLKRPINPSEIEVVIKKISKN